MIKSSLFLFVINGVPSDIMWRNVAGAIVSNRDDVKATIISYNRYRYDWEVSRAGAFVASGCEVGLMSAVSKAEDAINGIGRYHE